MKKLLLPIAACLLLSGCIDIARGEKVGTITKLAQQGLVFNTWEGQIIRGGLSGGSGGFGQSFEFTVEDPIVVEEIRAAMDSQSEVKITYHTEAITLWRSESGSHFVDKIEVLKK